MESLCLQLFCANLLQGGRLPQVLGENVGLVAAFELEDAALAYLAHALAGEIEQVAYLFQSLFRTTYAEAVSHDGHLALLEHLLHDLAELVGETL